MKNNVIIFHTDQQRYDSLGCNGNKDAKTPNIDALSKDGCRFTRHISANPTCMPSRASLLTGLYVPGHGVSSNGIPLWRSGKISQCLDDDMSMDMYGVKVRDKIPTLADILGESGYRTSLFGKLHLQPHLADEEYGFYESNSVWTREEVVEHNENFYGFQEKEIILGHGEELCGYNRGHYARWLHKNYPELVNLTNEGDNVKKINNGERPDIYLSKLPSECHNSVWLANEVCQYLDETQEDDKPMFMFVGFPDPHHPFTPPEDISKPFNDIQKPDFASTKDIVGEKTSACKRAMDKRRASKEDCAKAYQHTMASIYLIDKAIGQIINHLKTNGIYDDTIIIFTSDHGDYLGDFDMLTKSDLPFKNLIHVPFILKGTKEMELPKEVHTPMSNADVVPTVLKMLGIKPDDYIQGVDIFDELSKNNTPMVTCYGIAGDERNISILDNTYRYTYYLESKEEELYDHLMDPKELNNLVKDKSSDVESICRELKQKLFEKHIQCELGIFNHYSLW